MECLICNKQLLYLAADEFTTFVAAIDHFITEHTVADIVQALTMIHVKREESIRAN